MTRNRHGRDPSFSRVRISNFHVNAPYQTPQSLKFYPLPGRGSVLPSLVSTIYLHSQNNVLFSLMPLPYRHV
jgi:hypothetical protein